MINPHKIKIDSLIEFIEDILLELDDNNFRTNVSYYVDDFINIKILIARETPMGWGRFKITNIYDRIEKTLNIYRFSEIDRGSGNVSLFPVVDGMFEATQLFTCFETRSSYIRVII